MSRRINLLSVSGGKDSTALILHALERGVEFQCCFADTGHEHPETYEYLDYLRDRLGITIEAAKADFSKKIEGKRKFIEENWKQSLMEGRAGKWVKAMGNEHNHPKPDWEPEQREIPINEPGWMWQRELKGLSSDEADSKVALALEVLQPTGNPFLDMCIWKGRFPSTKGRFCTDELKTIPITQQIVFPLMKKTGLGIRSWQGVRAQESARRATYKMHEQIDFGVWVYRPLLKWTHEEVFEIHRKHGIKWNPLYMKGMNRVGCMPCIMCRKGELAEISRRFPEVIERLKKWEEMVAASSKRGLATFFDVRPFADDKYNINHIDHGIEAAARWARTERGGKQFNLFTEFEDIPSCSSDYGLCEIEQEAEQ
jgi:3'-phosphoadenosine 5'-phosphosulfate sulfotransferase (PAPS reductase)/FAD synthetase